MPARSHRRKESAQSAPPSGHQMDVRELVRLILDREVGSEVPHSPPHGQHRRPQDPRRFNHTRIRSLQHYQRSAYEERR